MKIASGTASGGGGGVLKIASGCQSDSSDESEASSCSKRSDESSVTGCESDSSDDSEADILLVKLRLEQELNVKASDGWVPESAHTHN